MSLSSENSSFVGLKNQGATCYLNSLIQTLFLTPEFRQELFSLTPNEVGLNSKRKKIIVELQKLFARLQSPEYVNGIERENISSYDTALSTKSLTNAFGWKDDQHMDQHDINELYNILLDGIEGQMPINKKILNKYYKGKIINIIQCQICKNDSKKYEEFVQLNVILQTMLGKSFDTLNESLINSFIDNIEELKDENAYFCTNCNKKVHAKKYCRLIQLPSIIVCNLNRFTFDFQTAERVKINKKFQFPKSLDLSMFVDNEYTEMDRNDIKEYDLIGIVVHRGSGANAGHYHAYIRDMNDEHIWKPIKRNKRKKKRRVGRGRRSNRNYEKSEKKKAKKEAATALLVSILTDYEQLKKNDLQTKFKQQNNFTEWSWSYGDVLGNFGDFIRNNHRFRVIDEETRNFSICLAHNDVSSVSESDSDDVEIQPPSPKPKPKPKAEPQRKKNKRGRPPKNKKKKKKDNLDGFVVSDDDEEGDEDYDDYEDIEMDKTVRKVRGNKNKNKKEVDTIDLISDDDDESDKENSNSNEKEEKENDNIASEDLIGKAHWFDFNDEDITAVLDTEIDDLYDGGDDECPYMVIYRKKCMNTGRWPPQIPEFVQSLLIDEPLDAEEDKQEINIGIIKLNLATKMVRKMDSDTESNDDDSDIDVEMNDNNNMPPPKSFSKNNNSNNSSDNKEREVIEISDDENENENNISSLSTTSSQLICTTPLTSPELKERQSKKRKYSHMSNSNGYSNSNSNSNGCNTNTNNSIQKPIDEPQKKKRKLQSLANLPNPNEVNKVNNKQNMSISPSPNNNKKEIKEIKKEYVKSEYLEAIQMTKGNTINELYIRVSEWSGIHINNLQIAMINSNKRSRRRNTNNNSTNDIINFESKEKTMKLKHIPIKESDDILVWGNTQGNLAEKESDRRKQCIQINIYILNREYPQPIYINAKTDTLMDLYTQIIDILTIDEKKSVEEKGRFRDVDTKEIYKYYNKNICKLDGIKDKCILSFQKEKAPTNDEIVIRYRLKTAEIKHAKDAIEQELYINKNDNINTLKTLMVSKFNVEYDKFDLRKGRKDWVLSSVIDCDNNVTIEQLKFDKTQRLILSENTLNKNERKLDIYCQTHEINGITQFKIPKNCLQSENESKNNNSNNNNSNNNSDGDGDVEMDETKEKEVVPCNDGLDIYDCNSHILCTIIIDKHFNGCDIKNAIINSNKWNLNTQLKKDLSPLHLRVSVRSNTSGQPTWQILGNEEKKIGYKSGKCIVEFFNEPTSDEKFGTQASGSSLVFVHKKVQNNKTEGNDKGAMYGSRYEIEISSTQRDRLDPLKLKIISACDFEEDTQPEDIMLATRNLLTHKWSVLEEKEQNPARKVRDAAKKNKKKVMRLKPKPYDRDIIAVLYTKHMNKNIIDEINGEYFETEWDKYYSEKYKKENESKPKPRENDDEPQIIINFNNDSQNDEENDDQKDNNNNNNNDSDK